MTSSAAGTCARAPGKVILFGEHAVNRGQPALAAAVGLYASCRATRARDGMIRFRSGERRDAVDPPEIAALARQVEGYRAAEHYEEIRALSARDYFAPQKYVLGALEKECPGCLGEGLELEWESEIPSSSGLGSGGGAFAAMVTALSALLPRGPGPELRGRLAHLGDVIAHGGIASGLDTQTSLTGGVIRYAGTGPGEPVPCAPGLCLVIGHTGVAAATSEVNTRVRRWLAERPESRMRYFESVGALTRAALPLLERGEWAELGRLLTLNQLVLEKIGVSCPEIERLVEAALGAGAYGAKLSGSGGGGIVVALVAPERRQAVADAIAAAGGRPLTPAVAVPGAAVC